MSIGPNLARAAHLLKCLIVSSKRRRLSAELLPPANDDVDVSRIDLQTQTHTLGLLSSNQRRPRTEEWIVDSLSTPGVIQDRSAHELDRLLRPMSGGGLVPIATKRI